MERKEAIDVLEKLIEAMQGHVTVLPSPERIEAIRMAIRCLKVDEMYDLSYEDADWYDKAIKENERLKKELEMLKLDFEVYRKKSQPVIHGKWEEIPKYKDIAWKCSECGHFTTMIHAFCPECGCAMDGGEQTNDTD